jgi:RecB family endonuclease NucS
MPHVMEEGLTLVRREHFTALGPVDIICRDAAGRTVVIEVKRRGEIDGVEQLTRYLADLANDATLGELRGMFVAQSIKPQARTLAESRGIVCVEVDYDELRGNKADDWTLFS